MLWLVFQCLYITSLEPWPSALHCLEYLNCILRRTSDLKLCIVLMLSHIVCNLAYRIHRKFAPFFAQIFAKKIVKCKNLHKKLRKHMRHNYFLAIICANIYTNFWASKIFAKICFNPKI